MRISMKTGIPPAKFKWPVFITAAIVMFAMTLQNRTTTIAAISVMGAIDLFVFLYFGKSTGRSIRNMVIAIGSLAAFAVVLYFAVNAFVHR